MTKAVDYNALYGTDDWTTIALPNGLKFLTGVVYTHPESVGVTVLIVVSFISLIAVLGLIIAILLSAFNTRSNAAGDHLFVRTQVATYFMCLLICNIIQCTGSIMNLKWVGEMSVTYSNFCRLQGEVKLTADVGTAIWSLFIAVHTFNLLFLQWEMHVLVLAGSVVVGWASIAGIVAAGPAMVNRAQRGPFFGIAGHWCWISDGYLVQRITLDYLIMFLSAFLCLALYLLVWLRVRGNIVSFHGRLRLRRAPPPENWRASDLEDNYTKMVAGRMVFYPVAYFVCILPIAICRFISWSGGSVPFEATIFSDAIFLLGGLVNVVLFTSTRRMLPPQSVIKWSASKRRTNRAPGNAPGSPGSCEKGTTPDELGIYLDSEPALMKSAAWDDGFNIAAQPPTPGVPRSPFAACTPFHPPSQSTWDAAQQQAMTRPPFTPKPFRLSMNVPRSPIMAGGERGWGQTEQSQTRPLRLSTGEVSAGPPRSPSAPPGLAGMRGGATSDSSPPSPSSPVSPPHSAGHIERSQVLPAEPPALKPFRLGSAPTGPQRRHSRGMPSIAGRGRSLGYIAPSPAEPTTADLADTPSTPFRDVEDELRRMRSASVERSERGAWSPSDERMPSPVLGHHAPFGGLDRLGAGGMPSAASDDSEYEDEAEPAFEIVDRR